MGEHQIEMRVAPGARQSARKRDRAGGQRCDLTCRLQGFGIDVLRRDSDVSDAELLGNPVELMLTPGQGVDERMNLGRQSAARSTDRLRAVFFRAPELCW
jgi:hypothetical protein